MKHASSQQQQELDSFDGERGMPSVNAHAPSTAKRGLIFLCLLLILGSTIALGYWKYQKKLTHNAEEATQKDLQLTSAVPPRTFSELPPSPPDVKIIPTRIRSTPPP